MKKENVMIIPKGKVGVEATLMDELIQARDTAQKQLSNAEIAIKNHKEFLKKELTKN